MLIPFTFSTDAPYAVTFIDRYVVFCFGGGSQPAPAAAPAAPPPPPSKMDESAAGRAASVEQIRARQRSGLDSTIGTSKLGDTSATPAAQKTLLGS